MSDRGLFVTALIGLFVAFLAIMGGSADKDHDPETEHPDGTPIEDDIRDEHG